jgi:restriction endonuclease S subunit
VFLQSEAGLVQLTRHSKGAVFNSISLEDLKKVKIPKVSREVQNQIADEYAKLKEQLIVIERQVDLIKDRRAKLLEGVV